MRIINGINLITSTSSPKSTTNINMVSKAMSSKTNLKSKQDHCCFNNKVSIDREITENSNGDIVCITQYTWCDDKNQIRKRKIVDLFSF